MSNNFLGIEEEFSSIENSQVVIIPVPYETSTSYMGGTKEGPQAIIDASAYVELYDEEIEKESYRKGIHTVPAIKFVNDVNKDFESITKTFSAYLEMGKFPIGLGGEHSISFPIFKAFQQKFDNLSVLQLDAHSDLRESYEDSIFSHACVMKRIYGMNTNIVQVGIRSQCIEEADFIKNNNINTIYAHVLKNEGFYSSIIDKLTDNVFITIDVDYFDPSVIPSTGTPEPGGFFWDETMVFLKKVFAKKNVVGFDVVELSPLKGLVHPDFTIAKMIYKLIGHKFY
ncbi:MAG: agmatinase [Calditrichaeota bacterium]|nr:agmatinase [Calditrichota bacterium]